MAPQIDWCCKLALKDVFQRQGAMGSPGEVIICARCRRSWAWQDFVWWKGPVIPEGEGA